MGAIICSLVTIDTTRELYFISTAWGHEATWHDILYIVKSTCHTWVDITHLVCRK